MRPASVELAHRNQALALAEHYHLEVCLESEGGVWKDVGQCLIIDDRGQGLHVADTCETREEEEGDMVSWPTSSRLPVLPLHTIRTCILERPFAHHGLVHEQRRLFWQLQQSRDEILVFTPRNVA